MQWGSNYARRIMFAKPSSGEICEQHPRRVKRRTVSLPKSIMRFIILLLRGSIVATSRSCRPVHGWYIVLRRRSSVRALSWSKRKCHVITDDEAKEENTYTGDGLPCDFLEERIQTFSYGFRTELRPRCYRHGILLHALFPRAAEGSHGRNYKFRVASIFPIVFRTFGHLLNDFLAKECYFGVYIVSYGGVKGPQRIYAECNDDDIQEEL